MRTRRSLPRLAVAVAATAAVALSGCSGDSSDSKTYKFTSATAVGKVIPEGDRKPAKDFSGALLTGDGKASLSDRDGKVVVIAFWASWCGPCKVEMPQLNDLHHDLGAKVAFLGIDSQDRRENARSFVRDNDIAFPIVYDQQGETALTLGNIPGSLPFTVLVDQQGRVAAVYVQRYAPKDLRGALDELTTES